MNFATVGLEFLDPGNLRTVTDAKFGILNRPPPWFNSPLYVEKGLNFL